MWFKAKKSAAPLYQDETYRRMFATASGRPKSAEKLKKLKRKRDNKKKGWFGRLFGRWSRR